MGFADTFKALSDPVRRDILILLKNGKKLSAGEIASHFDISGATISYHLNLLKKAELVMESKYKNFVYYELNTSVVEEIMLWLSELRGKEDYEEFKETDNRNNSSGADSLSGGSDSVEPPAGTGAHSLEF